MGRKLDTLLVIVARERAAEQHALAASQYTLVAEMASEEVENEEKDRRDGQADR